MINHLTFSLAGKTALVTGASQGIGKATATLLAAAGCQVFAAARKYQALEKLQQENDKLAGEIVALALDVTDEAQCRQSVREIISRQGSLDILVNNAGIYKTAAVLNHASDEWNKVISTNLTAPFILSRETLPAMMTKGWGRIINISSISGKTGEPYGAAYSASKFGLIGFSQTLALECAEYGITVNSVCPGWVDTEMSRRQLSDPKYAELSGIDIGQSWEIAQLSVPQKRFLQPEEIAQLILFLCSDMSKGITGQAINICGGLGIH